MSEEKLPHCSAADEPERGQPPNHNTAPACRNKNESGQRNGDAASSSPESGSVNGDVKRSGKSRRRRKRSSNPESRCEGKLDSKTTGDESANKKSRQVPDPHAVLMGLQAECANVWFEHSIYERAESLYQCWLAGSPHGTSDPNPAQPAPRTQPPPRSASAAAPCSSGPSCHHVVQAVWVNKSTFDHAELRFVEDSAQPSVPDSLDLASPEPTRTPDEGYQSLAPTPATPVVPPTSRQSINGLPRFPVELLRDVWLEKPLYDRAEAAFYQNLYGNNSTKRPGSASASRSSDHPQCLVEEEEEQDEEEMVVEEARVVQLGKAEVFHALHPIQEEEEPAEVPQADDACYFLHPDSERVWLDKWQYDAAESRFHGYRGSKVKKSPRPGADASSVASGASFRDNTMSAVDFLAQEKIWFDKARYDEAERRFYERMNGGCQPAQTSKDAGANTILQDIARARENIQKSLAGLKTSLSSRGSDRPSARPHFQLSSSGGGTADQGEIVSRIKSLELENQSLHKVVEDLRAALSKLECRVAVLEKCPAAVTPAPAASVPYTNGTTVQQKSSAPVKEEEEEEDDDDDIDLFGSDDDEEAEKLKEQRLKAYAEKKAKKPVLIAKSSILLDVKPWDDETDMAKLEECVRSVQADGLLWGTSKLVPVGYGINKLQIACVVEDDKVGTDMLEEEITKFEDYVQSVDIAAFNKI